MKMYKIFIYTYIFFLISCDTSVIHTKKINIAQKIWLAESNQKVQFIVQDTTQFYNIALCIEHTIDYAYQNLYITYYLRDTQDSLISTALKNCVLFMPKTGKPLGKGLGSIKHCNVLLENFSFPYRGTYTLELAQWMRHDSLHGIQSIQCILKPNNKKDSIALKF